MSKHPDPDPSVLSADAGIYIDFHAYFVLRFLRKTQKHTVMNKNATCSLQIMNYMYQKYIFSAKTPKAARADT